MSQSLVINNREYIPAGDVGKHFGYTRDYILLLAKEEKIDGKKIGHRWYVNLDSARSFFESARSEREARRQYVSEVRKAELRSFEEKKAKPKKTTALLETLGVLVVGLLLGVTGYVGVGDGQRASLSSFNASFLNEFALSLYELISPSSEFSVSLSEPVTQKTEAAVVESPSLTDPALAATSTHTSLVIAPGQVLTTTTIESIRDSFSDEVSVSMDPHNPDSGVIVPQFKNKEGEEYRFLMVPVKPGTP